MKSSKKSFSLHIAHYLRKAASPKSSPEGKDLTNSPSFRKGSGVGPSWSDLVAHAWYFVRFRQWLNQGVVRFSFFKKDGSIREAIGTTNLLLIPTEKHPKGTALAPVYSTINFFDLVKGEWRSFNILSFIGFVDRWELVPFRTKPEQKKTEKKNQKKIKESPVLSVL